MARTDSASRRLAKAFSIVVPDSALALVAADDEKTRHVVEWKNIDDDRIFGLACRNICTLTSDPGDALLARAFAAAKLNSNDPTHWRALLLFFAWAHYGDRGRRGAPKKWDTLRYSQMRKDFSDVKSRNPHLSDDDVFRILGRMPAYQTKRGPLSTSRLRKLFKAANDPTQNELLGTFRNAEPAPNSTLKSRT
jgi:hypothetical protein